jgi:hypothetical protein
MRAMFGLLAFLIIGAIGSAGASPLGQRFAQQQCQQRMPVIAGMAHRMWVAKLPFKTDPKPSDIGDGLAVLLWAIRSDPALAEMSYQEFVTLAQRICEPIYEAYYDEHVIP